MLVAVTPVAVMHVAVTPVAVMHVAVTPSVTPVAFMIGVMVARSHSSGNTVFHVRTVACT